MRDTMADLHDTPRHTLRHTTRVEKISSIHPTAADETSLTLLRLHSRSPYRWPSFRPKTICCVCCVKKLPWLICIKWSRNKDDHLYTEGRGSTFLQHVQLVGESYNSVPAFHSRSCHVSSQNVKHFRYFNDCFYLKVRRISFQKFPQQHILSFHTSVHSKDLGPPCLFNKSKLQHSEGWYESLKFLFPLVRQHRLRPGLAGWSRTLRGRGFGPRWEAAWVSESRPPLYPHHPPHTPSLPFPSTSRNRGQLHQ